MCFTNVTSQSAISTVKNALLECENINLNDILEAVKYLTKLKVLFYEVHTEISVCMVGNPGFSKNCANCEILKKDCPGLFI